MIYVIICISLVLAWLAERKGKTQYVFFLIGVLSLFVGFRAKTVGIDTNVYYDLLTNVQKGIISRNVEYPFLITCKILLKILNIEQVLMLISIITEILIILRFWELRNKGSFTMMILVFVVSYYPETANICRQYLSVAIVFWGTKFLDKSKIGYFLCCVLVAVLFHRSSVLAIAYVPIYVFFSSMERKKKKRLLVFFACLIPVAVLLLYKILDVYSFYFDSSIINSSFGLYNPAKLLIVLIFIIAYYNSLKSEYTNLINSEYIDMSHWMVLNRDVIVVVYIWGIVLCCLGYRVTSLYRMGLFFMLFEAVFWASACRHGSNRKVFRTIFILFILFNLYNEISGGWSGLASYSTWLLK